MHTDTTYTDVVLLYLFSGYLHRYPSTFFDPYIRCVVKALKHPDICLREKRINADAIALVMLGKFNTFSKLLFLAHCMQL